MRISGVSERHVRLSFSTARETLRSIEVLLQPSHHAEQMPWIRVARRKLRRDLKNEIEHFRFFFTFGTEIFPKLWGSVRTRAADGEFAALEGNRTAYMEAVVRRLHTAAMLEKRELHRMLKPGWYRPAAADYAERDPRAREMLEEFAASPSRRLGTLLRNAEGNACGNRTAGLGRNRTEPLPRHSNAAWRVAYAWRDGTPAYAFERDIGPSASLRAYGHRI